MVTVEETGGGGAQTEESSPVILRALRLIRSHPAVVEVGQPIFDAETETTGVDISVRLGLPNAWMADGVSPNGVRATEPVSLIFRREFPLRAPLIYLRSDFNRALAHVFPGPAARRPAPCVYDGNLDELLQQAGLAEILNQLVVWLEHAALEELIDPEQGWEPVRRDYLDDFVVADATHLRSLVDRNGGRTILRLDYLRFPETDGLAAIRGELGTEPLTINPKVVTGMFDERMIAESGGISEGRSIAIVAWPRKLPTGEETISGEYLPETVFDVGGLFARAAAYGCDGPLHDALKWLESCLSSFKAAATLPIVIVLCARRPFHLIRSDSRIELCTYVVEISAPRLFPNGDSTPVRPAGHRHAIASPLLRQTSGEVANDPTPPWVQLGCGSLGSKFAVHLARAGRAPSIVVDKGSLSPHNVARHGLIPSPSHLQLSWIGSKAEALASAIAGLGQLAAAYSEDVIAATRDRVQAKRLLPKKAWAVVNSTASLPVREALASVPSTVRLPRIIETTLFGAGRIGFLSIEGPGRNPNTADLFAMLQAHMREDMDMQPIFFPSSDAVQRLEVGEGCGSATMVMSDGRVSMFAASMAEFVRNLQGEGLPEPGGRFLVGVVADDGLSLTWHRSNIDPSVIVEIPESDGWQLRLSQRAHQRIVEEVVRWPTVETGGILLGRHSESAKAFYVVDVLSAPEDSIRSATEFMLGVKDVRSTISAYTRSSNASLYCLGTWHSHLTNSPPSAVDRATAHAIALARLAPSVLLIHTADGYQALLADAARHGHVTGRQELASTDRPRGA